MDLERLRYLFKEKLHGKNVPEGGSFSPVNVEPYLGGLSIGKKKELAIIARIDDVMTRANREGFYPLHISHNQIESDPWQQDSYEGIGWDAELGLVTQRWTKEPLGYPEFLQKLIIANLHLPDIVKGFIDDELVKAMNLPLSSKEMNMLPELLRKDQRRLAKSWLSEAQRISVTYPTAVEKHLEAARKFAIAGKLDDPGFNQQLTLVETRYHRTSLNRDLELVEEAKRSGKSQETFTLRALKHAIWLGEDVTPFKDYASQEVDRLLYFILDKTPRFEGFTQSELVALRWRDYADTFKIWLKVSGRDEKDNLAEIKKRLEGNSRVKNVPPIDF